MRELAQIIARDHFTQLGLAHQNELHQLILVGIDVGQQPQLFERLNAEVLRLVDDQHHMAALGVFVDGEILERLVQLDIIGMGVM